MGGEGWGLVGCSKEGQVQGRVGLLGSSTGGGKGSGESKGFGSGRVGVLFFESWRVDLVTCSRRGLPRKGQGLGGGGSKEVVGARASGTEQISQRVSGGYPPELAWWTGG